MLKLDQNLPTAGRDSTIIRERGFLSMTRTNSGRSPRPVRDEKLILHTFRLILKA